MKKATNKYSPNNYQFEVLNSFVDAVRYKKDWDKLVDEMESVSPCITFEWLSTWWNCLGNNQKELLIVIVKQSGVVVGIAPLMSLNCRLFFYKFKKLEYISMARYANSPSNIATSLDFIIPNDHDKILPSLFQFLKENSDWQFMRLNPIDSDSPTLKYLKQSAISSALRYDEKIVFHNVILNISDSWPDYFKSLSKNFRKQLSSTEKKLGQIGPISIDLFNTKIDIQTHLPDLLEIEKRSWKWNVGVSINSTGFGDFFPKIIDSCGDSGMLRLWMLKVGNDYIAYDYNLLFKNSLVNLKGSYDSKYNSYSPGNILLAKEIEEAFKQNFDLFNMLWDMTTTKQRWLPEMKPAYEIFIYKNNFIGNLINILQRNLKYYHFERLLYEYRNRILRKFRIRSKNSELTRMDQLNER